MTPIVYYEGADSIEQWVSKLLGCKPEFRKLPTSNNSNLFATLPAYVADILYLDKPDIIISGSLDGIHEKPIFAIELAACTPQYQHAIQRFSRLLASANKGCPSVLIIPKRKRENDGGVRYYNRSQAADYGAVKLTDIYNVPSLVIDWPDIDGELQFEGHDQLPPLSSPGIQRLSGYLREALVCFKSLDYLSALKRLALTDELIDQTRSRAYSNGLPPTIQSPGGGGGDSSRARLTLCSTKELLKKWKKAGRMSQTDEDQLPSYFKGRDQSLVFYPTRVTKKAGDPYVGMLTYYDIAFCRQGPSTRDRRYNLVADCEGVSIEEVTATMARFNSDKNGCPFNEDFSSQNLLRYSYHLKNGCSKTKIKPLRIYSEIADMMCFEEGVIVGV